MSSTNDTRKTCSSMTNAMVEAPSEVHLKTTKNCSPGLKTDLVKLSIGIAANVAGVVFPGAGTIGPILNFAIDRYVKRPQQVLVEELHEQRLTELSEDKATDFVPMAYRYFEAAKEGDYEHNLRILASFIANELKQEIPDVPAVSRMARRLEGLTKKELKVIAMIDAFFASPDRKRLQSRLKSERPFVSAYGLANAPCNADRLDGEELADALTEIASRGLLIPDGATRLSKAEEYYFPSGAFVELFERAGEAIARTSSEAD